MHENQYFDCQIHCAFCEPKIVKRTLRITENELSKHVSILVPVFAPVKNTENRAENFRRPKVAYLGDPASKLNNFGLTERAYMYRLEISLFQHRRRIFMVGGRFLAVFWHSPPLKKNSKKSSTTCKSETSRDVPAQYFLRTWHVPAVTGEEAFNVLLHVRGECHFPS